MQANLITNRSNIAYLSNFTGTAGFMLLTPTKNYLFTDARYIERAKNTIKKGIKIIDVTHVFRNPTGLKSQWHKILNKHKIHTLGIEEDDLTISRFKKFKKITPKVKFTNISGEMETKREIKTAGEIRLITKSQRINEQVLAEIKKIIRHHRRTGKKIMETDIVWKIKELGHHFGAEDISFEPIVAFGSHSARPHHLSGNTILKKNDIILIDMGMKYRGYCSDMTRMILPPKPTPKQQKIYNLVLKAQQHAIKNIRPGMSGKQADTLSRNIIKKAGYGEKYIHSGGHGIGLDIHEIPSLAESYGKKIRRNSIITVEPGIYLEGEFGVRIEDMILITNSLPLNLTNAPR
ncbi:M24 family metallopeptidase [Candidatus Peregrinibacteria bacterium]|nr:M24 family metallopeptidase [Candidatus Peregrinibacteria bacterium]